MSHYSARKQTNDAIGNYYLGNMGHPRTSIVYPTMRDQYPEFFRLGGDLSSGNTDFDETGSKTGNFGTTPIQTAEITESNVVLSRLKDIDHHKVVIDLDMDAVLIPSSTPGHHHLIIDKTMPWNDYANLLASLRDAGLIQDGYYKASVNRGASVIRTPWTKKETK